MNTSWQNIGIEIRNESFLRFRIQIKCVTVRTCLLLDKALTNSGINGLCDIPNNPVMAYCKVIRVYNIKKVLGLRVKCD